VECQADDVFCGNKAGTISGKACARTSFFVYFDSIEVN